MSLLLWHSGCVILRGRSYEGIQAPRSHGPAAPQNPRRRQRGRDGARPQDSRLESEFRPHQRRARRARRGARSGPVRSWSHRRRRHAHQSARSLRVVSGVSRIGAAPGAGEHTARMATANRLRRRAAARGLRSKDAAPQFLLGRLLRVPLRRGQRDDRLLSRSGRLGAGGIRRREDPAPAPAYRAARRRGGDPATRAAESGAARGAKAGAAARGASGRASRGARRASRGASRGAEGHTARRAESNPPRPRGRAEDRDAS